MIHIYALICPQEGTVKYVGKSNNVRERFLHHHIFSRKSDCSYAKKNWINKLRKNNMFPVLSILEKCTEDNWAEREIYWIKKLKDDGYPLLNISKGGESVSYWEGKTRSEETKRKISETKMGTESWNKGLKMPEEFCEKLRQANLGKIHTEETRKKISDKLKGQNTWIKGHKLTDEHKRAISKANSHPKGPFSEEHKRKLSEAHKGKVGYNKGFSKHGLTNEKIKELLSRKLSIKEISKEVGCAYSTACEKVRNYGVYR